MMIRLTSRAFVCFSTFVSVVADSNDEVEKNRLLAVASAAYESNIESLDRGLFEFSIKRIDTDDDPERRILSETKTAVGRGFYAFDRDAWHYRITYGVEDLRKHTSRVSDKRGFRIRKTLFPVDIVSDGKVMIEHLERYDQDSDSIRHEYQVRNGSVEEFGSLIHFPLRLGLPSAKSQGFLADLDLARNDRGVTVEDVDSVMEQGLRVIRVKLRSKEGFVRTYLIDVNRGGIPLRIFDEAPGPGTNQIKNEKIYGDIREYPGRGWFPHRMNVRNIGQNEVEFTLQKADFDPNLTSVDFSIRSDSPVSLADAEVNESAPKRRIWSISDVKLTRQRFPKAERTEVSADPSPMPGPRPVSDHGMWRYVVIVVVMSIAFVLLIRSLSSRRSTKSSSRRAGFTLIEVLVAILIVGVITALLLPAIQSARESARRAKCSDRMKQVGLALSQYQSLHGTFPGSTFEYDSIEGNYHAMYSVQSHSLPFLEMKPLYDSINFSLFDQEERGLLANRTAMLMPVTTYLCPSDPGPKISGFGRCNLRFCSGPAPESIARDGYFRSGAFGIFGCTSPGMVTDGLSNTVAMSERVQGSWDLGKIDRFADYNGGYKEIYADRKYDVKRAYDYCLALPDSEPFETRSGESWMVTSLHSTTYNHVFVPNASQPDCTYTGVLHERFDSRFLTEGVFSARSYHAGGVNVGFLDGHVRFVRSGVDLAVWRALSTRNQGESISADSF